MQANLPNSTTFDPIDALSASDLADATQAEALNNNFIERQQQLLYTDPDAFYGKQGEDALTATPGILDRLQDLRQEMLDVAPTPGIRQRLTRSLDGHMIFTRDNVLRHTRREAKAYQAATAQKRIDLLGTQAALDYSDPESVATYAEAAAHAGRAQALATDSDPDDTVAAAASSVWRNAIAGALARNDANTASALHRQAADALRPSDAAALANQMAAAQENLTGQTYAAGLPLPSPDPAAPLDAEQALADIDAAHQVATAQNATEHGDNPSQQATNQHFIDIRFGNARRDVEQSGADLDQAVNNWLDQPDTDGTPQTERPPLGLWTRLLPDVQRAVDAVLSRNARRGTDQNLILASSTDDDEEEAKGPPGDRPIHAPTLPEQDRPHHLRILDEALPMGPGPVRIQRGGGKPAPKREPTASPQSSQPRSGSAVPNATSARRDRSTSNVSTDDTRAVEKRIRAKQKKAGLLGTQGSGIGIGRFATDSMLARSPRRNFNRKERERNNTTGYRDGCHTCGIKNPGTKSGNFYFDHQSPNRLNLDGEEQLIFPQCKRCSARQGGLIAQKVKREELK